MVSQVNGYINPFSRDFQASASHYHDMSTGSQILTIFFSAFAFLMTLPLLGVAGFATFKSLVDRLAPIDKSHSKTTEKVDAVAEKKEIKPNLKAESVQRRRRTTKTQVLSLLSTLELQVKKAQGAFLALNSETLLDDELKTGVDEKKKFEKLLQLADLYKLSQTEIAGQIPALKKKIHLLPKSQHAQLLEKLEDAENSHAKLDLQILTLLVKFQPKIAKIFLDIYEGLQEELDQKIKKEADERLEQLDALCSFIQTLFERIQKKEDLHCDVRSLEDLSSSSAILPWFTSLFAAYLSAPKSVDDKRAVHDLVIEPAKILKGKVVQEISQRLVEKKRADSRARTLGTSRKGFIPYGTNASAVRNSRVRTPSTPQPGGLNNLGNTCFMNSSLQVILNTSLAELIDRDIPEPMFYDFYDSPVDDELLVQYLQNPELIENNLALKIAVKNFISATEEYPRIRAHQEALQKLKAVYAGKDTSISIHKALSDLRAVAISTRTRLVELPPSYSQQDAGEFLSAALRGIAFHFNMRKKIASDDGRDTSEIVEMTHYLSIPLVKKKVEESAVEEEEAKCGKPEEKKTVATKSRTSRRPPARYQSDFQEMLQAYKVEHKDDPDNKWESVGMDGVRHHQKYSQTYEIVGQIPDTLVVQVKRFEYTSQGRIARKDSTSLLMGEEVDFRTIIDDSLLIEDVSTRYRVVGIVNHGGSIGGGHYTADVKIEGKWENRSDSIVTKNIPASTTKSHLENGYIFVFERIK